MPEITTDHLEQILLSTSPSGLDKYLKEDRGLTFDSISAYLLHILSDRDYQQADIIKKSGLNPNYANGIFNGHKPNPHRDYIVAICLACQMSLSEVQRALKLSHAGILYAKDPRDAALIICINRKVYDITQVNEFLDEHHFVCLKGTV